MIAVPPGVRILLAAEPVDFRKGMNGLALQVQEVLERDPYSGHLFVFRKRRLKVTLRAGSRRRR